MKYAYVLCLNDYPEAVFDDEDTANRFRNRFNMPEKGRFWHVNKVPINPGTWFEMSVKSRELLR